MAFPTGTPVPTQPPPGQNNSNSNNNAAQSADKFAGAMDRAGEVLGVYIGSKLIPGFNRIVEVFGNLNLALGKVGSNGRKAAGEQPGQHLGAAIGGTAVVALEIAGAALTKLKEVVLNLAAAATPGGMQLFNEAVMLAMASLGAGLMPLIPLLATAVLTLADAFKDSITPIDASGNAINSWGEKVRWIADLIDGVVVAFNAMALGLIKISQFIIQFLAGPILLAEKIGKKLGDKNSPVTDMIRSLNKWSDDAEKEIRGNVKGRMGNMADRMPGQKNDTVSDFNSRFKTTIVQMQRMLADQFGVKPQFSGIGDVWKQNQLRAMQKPFEQELLKILNEQLEHLKKQSSSNEVIAKKPAGLGR